MRKLILIAALVLTSAAAQAGQTTRGLIVASNEPVPSSAATSRAETAVEPKAEIKPQSAAEKPAVTKRETDEQKARRIAARYGISW